MGLTGLIYYVAPRLGSSRLARWHFWLHIGLPLMILEWAPMGLATDL